MNFAKLTLATTLLVGAAAFAADKAAPVKFDRKAAKMECAKDEATSKGKALSDCIKAKKEAAMAPAAPAAPAEGKM